MTVPFLIDFTPHQFLGNICQSIEDMVFINIQQRVPSTGIEYNLGSLDDISLPISIQNVTNNADLEVTITETKTAFLIDNQPVVNFMIKLSAGETKNFIITLNKKYLDALSNNIDSILNIKIKNITNGATVTRNRQTNKLTVNFLDNTL